MDYVLNTFHYKDPHESKVYTAAAEAAYTKAINETKGSRFAFMEFVYGTTTMRVVYELFSGIAPKTCDNFLQLCIGYQAGAQVFKYTGTEINRVVKGMYIQAGKITGKTNHPHGHSIYGGEFADESFAVKHSDVGLLGMCKRSGIKNSNEC